MKISKEDKRMAIIKTTETCAIIKAVLISSLKVSKNQ